MSTRTTPTHTAPTQALRGDYERAKAECARLTEALRTLDPNRDTTETEIKARLVAEILKIRALKARLDQRAGTFASSR